MDYQFDLVSVGSGPAGQRAAVQAAKLGKRAALIERRRLLGGVCVDTGTIPSKTFREAILSFTCGSLDGAPGHRPESRPTADLLLQRVNSVVAREVRVIEDQLRRNDVEVIFGEASFKDPTPYWFAARTDGERSRPAVSSSQWALSRGPFPACSPTARSSFRATTS
jgi:NAD(P) transhydrogenase